MIETLLAWLSIYSGWPTFRTGNLKFLPEVQKHPGKRELLFDKLNLPFNTILACFRIPLSLAAVFVAVAVTIFLFAVVVFWLL